MRYKNIKAPEWYTGKANNGYVREHLVVACIKYGITEIPSGFEVHHINGNKKDNRPENLFKCCTSMHRWIHFHMLHQAHKYKGHKPSNSFPKGKLNPSSIPIMCVENGMVFDTIKDAEIWLGVSRGAVAKSIRQNRKCKKHTFKKI